MSNADVIATLKQGDRVRITITEDNPHVTDAESQVGESRTLWVVQNPDDDNNLWTYHGRDPFAPQVPITEVLQEPGLQLDLDLSVDEALPTVPGLYRETSHDEQFEFLREILGDELFEATRAEAEVSDVWRLNDDGTWTDPEGTTRPVTDNFLLVVSGYEFEPAAADAEFRGDERAAEREAADDAGTPAS